MFDLGEIVITHGIAEMAAEDKAFAKQLCDCLKRHINGDWGDLDKEDWEANDRALEEDDRILSAYDLDGVKIWIITEADRSCTTILLPDEY